MARLRRMWHAVIERASIAGRRQWWQNLPRPQWSVSRVALMGALLVVSGALVWHCEGNAWVFCSGTVVTGQLVGAACGVPFRRITQGAVYGAMLGLLLFAYALVT